MKRDRKTGKSGSSKLLPRTVVKVLERYRDRKTGRFTTYKAKGSKKFIRHEIRWGGGAPKGVRGKLRAVELYAPRDFRVLQDIPFKKVRGGVFLLESFQAIDIYNDIIKKGVKLIEVRIKGKVRRKVWKTKFVLSLERLGTADRIGEVLLARTLNALNAEKLRLSPKGYKSAKWGATEHQKLLKLDHAEFQIRYV